jgi:sarcosine oxidase
MAGFDIVVVGLGAMGSAALYHLARRHVRVLGIERFEPGHDHGSSHGETRMIRLGYFEHPSYVPLLRRGYQLWRELEAQSSQRLLHVTGIIEIGPPDGIVVPGTLAASRMHDLPHEILDAGETRRRFPAFRLPDDYVAVLQQDGGFLAAEPAIQTHLALAQAAGAQLRTSEAVRRIEPHGSGVRLTTERAVIEAGAAIVTAGPWTKNLLPGLAVPLRVTRQVMAWFAPVAPAQFGRFPVFLLESRHGIHYGFPLLESGMKAAKHYHRDEAVQPDASDHRVSAADEAIIRAALADHLPDANGPLLAAKTCLYTMTPDGDFLIDRLPEHPNILVASACSGHGFKFAGVVGEILADLATTGSTVHDISRFRLARTV